MNKSIIALLVAVMVLAGSSLVGASNMNIEVEQSTSDIELSSIPQEIRGVVIGGDRGRLLEISYPVSNYINQSRQLVSNQDISSEEAGREVVQGDPIIKRANIYLPPGYDENDPETKYNVLYLLHGVGGNRNEWLWERQDGRQVMCNIFDNLIFNGEIDPLIVVFPEGRSAHDWENNEFPSNDTNVLGFYYFDYELRYDLIPFIESTYNTYANITDTSPEAVEYNRKHRAIAGLSMGGMQALNLTFGGYRHDSAMYTIGNNALGNGLTETIVTPGMQDLFAYVGAFANAPTSSNGNVLGDGIASSGYKTEVLYITCGDVDGIALTSFRSSINGLLDKAGDNLVDYYQVVIRGVGHDFGAWSNGAYNFVRLIFDNEATPPRTVVFKDNNGEELGSLELGEYILEDFSSLGFELEEVFELEVLRGHVISFYETENFHGDTWHFISADDFNGADMSKNAKSFSVINIDSENVALNRPVDANVRSDRANRAVDGDNLTSWAPKDTPPYWLTVDLEDTYLLNRWIVRLQGTSPLFDGMSTSPLNAADFRLQVSEDGSNWYDADIVEGNTYSITLRDLNLIPARYARLYVTRPTSLDTNQDLVVYEFEVYGIPVE